MAEQRHRPAATRWRASGSRAVCEHCGEDVLRVNCAARTREKRRRKELRVLMIVVLCFCVITTQATLLQEEKQLELLGITSVSPDMVANAADALITVAGSGFVQNSTAAVCAYSL